jgi:cell wall-associated protease
MAIKAVPNGDEYDKDIANAIRYAVDNGAKIINMSFGKKLIAT